MSGSPYFDQDISREDFRLLTTEELAQRSKNRDLVNLIQRELRNRWVSEEFIEDLETEIDTVDDRHSYSEEMAKRVSAN